MKTFLSLLVLLLVSCTSHPDPSGFWKDETGLSAFEIKSIDKSTTFILKNSTGTLQGKLVADTIRGVTAAQDTFAFFLLGDSAYYDLLGVKAKYYRTTQKVYEQIDSVSRL